MAQLRLKRYEVKAGQLPAVCMFCGQPATSEHRRTFFGHPRGMRGILVAGLLLRVGQKQIKRMTVHIPVCERHKNPWRRRDRIVSASFLAVLGTIALLSILVSTRYRQGGYSWSKDYFALAALVGGALLLLSTVFGVFIFILQRCGIGPSEVTDHTITFVGVHAAFIDAFKKQKEEADPLHTSRRWPQAPLDDRERFHDASPERRPEPPETIREDES